jgi:hypothetical protein
VRVTPRKLSSGLLLALLATCLFLAASAQTWAQTAKRSFQMALWPDTSAAVVPTPSDADIKSFWEIYGQPAAPARAVVLLQTWQTNAALPAYDWSRILAVEIDEPYATNLVQAGLGGSLNPCDNDNASGDRMKMINSTMQVVAKEAAMVNAISPSTRVWVIFSAPEVEWMRDPVCQLPLNQPYIDVIAVDHYGTPFSPDVQSYYDWFIAHPATPHQQLALIPGTYYLIPNVSPASPDPQDSPDTQASFLQGYFDYANSMNQNCNLSLGSRGRTWSFDGCRVWIVMGWLGGNYFSKDVGQYVGELDPRAGPITTAWRKEVRPTKAQILQNVVLPVVLGN